ncbi:MAG: YceI family protein [Dehalococcoidia bacterium]|nr:YceI family protein [Dehalococcoidia bacterium]
MNPRKLLIFGGIAAVLVVIAAAGWYFFIRDDAPEEVSLAGALESINTPSATATTSATTSAGNGSTATATATATTGGSGSSSQAADGIEGDWAVSSAGDSFVGYRVKEELARVGATTAVGRSSVITADVTIADGKLVSGTVEADVTKLESDQGFRDRALQDQGIETRKFPTATFVANGNLAIPDGLEDGQAVNLTLPGKLTLHGVTKDVEIPVEAQLVEGRLVIVGSLPIAFGDYDIDAPSAASVVSIDDNGTMEFQLILERA